jgi:hypothetical protein
MTPASPKRRADKAKTNRAPLVVSMALMLVDFFARRCRMVKSDNQSQKRSLSAGSLHLPWM